MAKGRSARKFQLRMSHANKLSPFFTFLRVELIRNCPFHGIVVCTVEWPTNQTLCVLKHKWALTGKTQAALRSTLLRVHNSIGNSLSIGRRRMKVLDSVQHFTKKTLYLDYADHFTNAIS